MAIDAEHMRQRQKRITGKKALKKSAAALLVFGLAAFISLTTPMSKITLTRDAEARVTLEGEQRILGLVPIKRIHVENVQSVSCTIERPPPAWSGTTGATESMGYLSCHSPDHPAVMFEVSPASIEEASHEINFFITTSNEDFKEMWLIANWLFAVVVPGVIVFVGLATIVPVIVAQLRPALKRFKKSRRRKAFTRG